LVVGNAYRICFECHSLTPKTPSGLTGIELLTFVVEKLGHAPDGMACTCGTPTPDPIAWQEHLRAQIHGVVFGRLDGLLSEETLLRASELLPWWLDRSLAWLLVVADRETHA